MLEHAELLRWLHYDPLTGRWTRLLAAGCRSAGVDATVIRAYGKRKYRYRTVDVLGRRHKASRLAWFYVYGKWPTGIIDHRDGDTLNDCFSNYRDCEQLHNCWNSKIPKTNTSGYKGVSWSAHKKKWGACIRVHKKTVWLGYSDVASEAAVLYSAAAFAMRGEFARG